MFSGIARKGSVAAWTKKLSAKWGVKVQIDMVDIRVRPHLDLTKASVQKELLNKISSGFYAAVIFESTVFNFHQSYLFESKRTQASAILCSLARTLAFDLDGKEKSKLGKFNDRFFFSGMQVGTRHGYNCHL